MEAKIDILKLPTTTTGLTVVVGEGGPCGRNNIVSEERKEYGIRRGKSHGPKWLGGYGGGYSAIFVDKGNRGGREKLLLLSGGGGGAGTKAGEPGREIASNELLIPYDLKEGYGEGGGEFLKPGISKGGVGGRSFVDRSFVEDVVCFPGKGTRSGVEDSGRLIPLIQHSDLNCHGFKHGEGGNLTQGAPGCIEIGLPQYFFDTDPSDDQIARSFPIA